jgi:hypothetical protein
VLFLGFGLDWRRTLAASFLAVRASFTIFVAVTFVLDIAFALRGTAAVTVAAIVVAVTAVILATRRVVTTARWRLATSATTWGAFATRATFAALAAWWRVTSRVESPRGRWRSTSPLDLQEIIPADALVVHLMVSIISVTTGLIFDKSKETARRRTRGRNVAADKAAVALEFKGKVASTRAMAEACDVERSATAARHVE